VHPYRKDTYYHQVVKLLREFEIDEELDDIDFGSNMVGFVFDSKGMMGNFTMEGTRFERITPDLD